MRTPSLDEIRRECERLRLPADDAKIASLHVRLATIAAATSRLVTVATDAELRPHTPSRADV